MNFASLRRVTLALMLISSAAQAGTEHPAMKRKFDLPPSADLVYAIHVVQSGLSLNGDARLNWRAGAGHFSIDTQTHSSLFGKIIESKTSGAVDSYGLAPDTFIEKRFRKEPTTTTFNRGSKNISFATASGTYPLLGGEQDRNSAIWQLIAIARANPIAFKPDSTWDFFVAGPRDAEAWQFKVLQEERIRTPLGEQRAIHISRAAPPDAKGQQLDIWLAPTLEWYPLRLRFSDGDGDYIEQTLEKIERHG